MNQSVSEQTYPSRFNLLWLVVFLAVAYLLGYGYYLQYVEYLDPCPLCMTQRFFYYVIGICALIGMMVTHSWGWMRFMAFVSFLGAVGGLITAGRQIWLQHLPPDQVPECGPGLQYWLANKPYLQTLELLFKGDGNCAEVHWRFLGLSIAEWSFIWFAIFALVALRLLFARKRVKA